MKHFTIADIEHHKDAFQIEENNILNGNIKTFQEGVNTLFKDDEGNLFSPSSLLYDYLCKLQKAGFNSDKAVHFTKIIEEYSSFKQLSNALYSWFDEVIIDPYFERIDTYKYTLKKSEGFNLDYKKEILHFCCFIAISSIKNDAYYRKKAAFAMLDAVEQLGSMEVEYLRLHGSDDLTEDEKTVITPDYEFKANDVFCTIDMKVLNETAQTYIALLKAINRLLKSKKFPESFNVAFQSNDMTPIPIKGLQMDAMHQFIGNAMQYESAFDYIEEFARLALSRNEWYIDFDNVSTIPTGMYATLALAYANKRYFYLLQQFLIDTDSEHSIYHHHLFDPFILKYGITADTLPLILGFVESDSDYLASTKVVELANTESAITLLKQLIESPSKYFPCEIYREYTGNTQMWSKEECERFFVNKVICALYGTRYREDKCIPPALGISSNN